MFLGFGFFGGFPLAPGLGSKPGYPGQHQKRAAKPHHPKATKSAGYIQNDPLAIQKHSKNLGFLTPQCTKSQENTQQHKKNTIIEHTAPNPFPRHSHFLLPLLQPPHLHLHVSQHWPGSNPCFTRCSSHAPQAAS